MVATKEIAQSLLKKIAQNRAALEELKKEVEHDEALVLEALKEGAEIGFGLFTAEIKTTERRNTAWKEKAIEQVDEMRGEGEGAKWAARVIAATKPSTSERLVVKIAG
ncbi:MAG TPA: hypothetical protein VMI32_07040 [Candidatus Solibacter sp.]|nr:hypothetical protein [Candidatus Solibacter sp.]